MQYYVSVFFDFCIEVYFHVGNHTLVYDFAKARRRIFLFDFEQFFFDYCILTCF